MIGIVVVSHSRPLADAAVDLARQMVHAEPGPRVAVAAGVGDGELGTDATAVSAAIEEVSGPDGVLVLLDLGSAVLSAELAVDLLEPDADHRVRLSGAPLVEGLVAALVLAATGADLDTVAAEAEQGLAAKQAHLAVPAETTRAPEVVGESARQVDLTLTDPHGLHARPAAQLVALAHRFPAFLGVSNLDRGTGPVNARSLSAVATLDARQGHRLRVTVAGQQADEALAELQQLAVTWSASGRTPRPEPAGRASGRGLDLAMGPALVRRRPDVSAYAPGTVDDETRRSRQARDAARAELLRLERRDHSEAAAMLAAQRALLEDPEITDPVLAAITAGASAVDAWRDRLDTVADRFAGLTDAYQRERATDVRSVRDRVLTALAGDPETTPDPGEPVVLVVDELDAATAATVEVDQVAGIVVLARGRTGHGAIVAASRGIPLFTGAGAAGAGIRTGQRVAFDVRRGQLWTTVDDERVERWPDYLADREAERHAAVEAARGPALTLDGVRVPVLANLASVADAEAAAANGADGSGLVRTEVLFADHREAPSVADQAERLLALAGALGGRPITVRTWDVGGDKTLPFLPLPREDNPFLGVRGLRAFLGPEPALPRQVLVDQLAAVCAVARQTPVHVMFPMVTVRAEVDAALDLLREAAGGDVPAGLEVGVMIETPAAALTVSSIAAGLDFVSIGTNDLTQYVAAADRGSDRVAELADPLSPAVLRLIGLVGRERPPGVRVAVCGDLASRPEAVPRLLALGIDELSCAPPLVPEIKAAVRQAEGSGGPSLTE